MSLQFDQREVAGFGGEWRASKELSHEAVFPAGSCFGEFNYCNCIIMFEP